MKKVIKTMLAFAAVLLCGGALAEVSPLVQFTSLANNAMQEGFKIVYGTNASASDNNVSLAFSNQRVSGLEIQLNDEAKAALGNTATIVVDYDSYTKPNANHTVFAAQWGMTDHEHLVWADNNAKVSQAYVQNNNVDGDRTGAWSPDAIPTSGKLVVSMCGVSEKQYWKVAFLTAEGVGKVYQSAISGNYVSTDNFNVFKIGGSFANNGSYHRPAMTITGVTIYKEGLDAVFPDFAFKPHCSVGFDGNTWDASTILPDGSSGRTSATFMNENGSSTSTHFEDVRESDSNKALRVNASNPNVRPSYKRDTPFNSAVKNAASWSTQIVVKPSKITDKRIALWGMGDTSYQGQANAERGVALLLGANGLIEFVSYGCRTTTALASFESGASLYDGRYHAVMVTCDKSAASDKYAIYIDGAKVCASGERAISAISTSAEYFEVGTVRGGANELHNSNANPTSIATGSYFDDVAVWAYPLNPAEVSAIAAKFKLWPWPGKDTDLLWTNTSSEVVTIDSESTALNIFGRQIVINGADKLIFNANASIAISDEVSIDAIEVKGGTLSVNKGATSGVFNGERVIVDNGATLYINYVDSNAPVFPSDTETTIVLNGGSVTSKGWPTVEGTVNFETCADTTIWTNTVCSTGKIVKSGDATLTLGALLTNRRDENYIPHDVEIVAGTLKLSNAANVVKDLTIASGAALDFAGSSGSLTVKGKLTVNSDDCFTIPSTFTLDSNATVAIGSGSLKSTRNDLTITDVPEDKIVVLSDADGEGYYTYSIDVPVASITVGDTTTKYASVAAASAAALAAGATAESPQTVTLLCNSIAAIEIPEYVTINPAAYKFMGAITGTGTIELACTDNSTTAEIGSWFASDTLTGFTGCVKIAGGRIKATAALESGVKIKVVDGGQLWIRGGTWSNTFEVSGNGWEGEKSNNDISYAAIRVDGSNAATAITISGSITASVENRIVPTIGVHSSTAATISGSISCANGVRLISESATGVLTITGAINGGEGEPSPVVEKIGSGKVVFGSTATVTNLALKLSAGKIEKTSSTTFSSATTDVENKLVLITSTEAKLIDRPSLEDQTTSWGSDSNTTYLSQEANTLTPIFVSTTSLEDISNGSAKLIGKIKGTWVDAARDLAVATRDNYVYVDGSNMYEIQCQMYDGKNPNKSDYYTKVQNVTLYQIKDGDNYYIFAKGSQGYYLGDGTDKRGSYIEKTATGVNTNTEAHSYEVIKLEIDTTTEGLYNGKEYASILAAIKVAQANPGHNPVTLRADTTANIVVPSGVVLELNNHTISGQVRVLNGGWITQNGVVKIDGFTTSFDIAYDNKITFDYQQEPKATSNIGEGSASYFLGDEKNELKGIYIKHQPYIGNIPGGFFDNTSQLTMAIVGTMPSEQNTIFAHMGDALDNTKYGVFLATGANENEVVVAYNNGQTSKEITKMKVPNAATARHLYIITKKDSDTKAVFTIYLDGQKFKTATYNKFIIKGGVQLGRTFNQAVSGYSSVGDSCSAYVNVLRVYDRVISNAEINRYKEVYQYESIDGNYSRTVNDATANWSEDDSWSRTDVNPHEQIALPTAGVAEIAFDGNTAMTVNQTVETNYEVLTINGPEEGDATVTFSKGDGAIAVKTYSTIVNTPIVIKEGSLDLSGGPTVVGESGKVTFDFSAMTEDSILASYPIEYPVTGVTEKDENFGTENAKFALVKDSTKLGRFDLELVYDEDGEYYKVVPTSGAKTVYYISGYLGDYAGEMQDVVLKDAEDVDVDVNSLISIDTIVIGEKTTATEMGVGSNIRVHNLKIEKDYPIYAGTTDAILDNVTITIADNATLTIKEVGSAVTLGDTTFDGATVKIANTMSTGTVSGTATVEIVDGATLMPNAITSTVSGRGVIKVGDLAVITDSAVTSIADGDGGWKGTVWLKNKTGLTNMQLWNYGNANSTLKLSGVQGYFETGAHEITCKVKLENDGHDYGLNIHDGSSNDANVITFDEISGSGLLKADGGSTAGFLVKKWDDFTGNVELSSKTLTFGTVPKANQNKIIVNTGVTVNMVQNQTFTSNIDVAGTIAGAGTITGNLVLADAAAKATVASVSGTVRSSVDGYDVICNDLGSLKFYELQQQGAKPPAIVVPEGTPSISVLPDQDVTVPAGFDAANVTVKYGGTTLSGGESQYVTVSIVDNKIVLETTDAAKPAETAIAMAAPTEEGADKVQFTITNPIPGLFYAVSSCDTPDGTFAAPEGVVGDQATSTADKTVSIPMEFSTGKKVKYYKVSVKATK